MGVADDQDHANIQKMNEPVEMAEFIMDPQIPVYRSIAVSAVTMAFG
jgi:hypothetical protein